jgi:UDP-2,4-diacetamido-2,4,6-trideoxy-beta-L-altropyranose hydrolase
MPKPRIIFRADGNSQIGLGHIMRCLALSEMLNCYFDCVFVIAKPSEALATIIKSFGELVQLESTNKQAELCELDLTIQATDIVVVDGYLFDEKYIQYLKNKAHKLVIIDDLAEVFYTADIVLNHGNSSFKNVYKASANAKVLCGFDYLILRSKFLKSVVDNKSIDDVNTAFICMGGADPTDITIKVLRSCIKVGFFKKIIVVTGVAYKRQKELLSVIEQNQKILQIDSYTNASAATLVKLISDSQVCICPSSTIALEVCCVGAGLLTGLTASNQKSIHQQLLADECAVSVGDFNDTTELEIIEKLKSLSGVNLVNRLIQNQRKVIDGKSAKRILNEFKLLVA